MKSNVFKAGMANYLYAAYGYTWVRKFFQLWDAKSERSIVTTKPTMSIEYIMKPMLLGEKLGIFGICLLIAPVMMPVYLVNDLNKLDLYMKNEKQSDYGYTPPKHPLDYIFI